MLSLLRKIRRYLLTVNNIFTYLPCTIGGILFTIIILGGCVSNPEKQNLPDPLEAGWKGNSVCSILSENERARVLKCVFPPGVGHERHYHDPHMGYTIAGGLFKITDEKGTREVEVKTGTTFEKEEITSHEVLNIGTSTASFLIIEYK
ncbi:MAG: quercetin dioxygenase-like cupin family protein [Marinoscillum sp.]|jgi:quercetin dioxygenase-like cupin family protein